MERQNLASPGHENAQGTEPLMQKKAGTRKMPPPPIQLAASSGFPSESTSPMAVTSEGPIQRVGRPDAPQSQLAGTCGLYSIANGIAHVYRLGEAETKLVRDKLLLAAGQVDTSVTMEGEITSFGQARAIVAKYNELCPQYQVEVTQQSLEENPGNEKEWREDLGISEEPDESQHAVAMAVDSRLYSSAVKAARGGKVKKEDQIKGTTAVKKGNVIEVSDLSADNASDLGSHAHWVTITSISDEFIDVMDPNYPKYTLRFNTKEAALLSNSLAQHVKKKDYLKEVYGKDKGGNQKTARNWVSEMSYQGKNQQKKKVYKNQDWKTMMSEDKGEGHYLNKVINRLKKVDDTTEVQLTSLAVRIVKANTDV